MAIINRFNNVCDRILLEMWSEHAPLSYPTTTTIKCYIEDPIDIAKRSNMSYDAFLKDLNALIEVFERNSVSVLGHYKNVNDYENILFIAAKIAKENLSDFLKAAYFPNAVNNKTKTMVEMLSAGQKNASVMNGKTTPNYCIKMLEECPNVIYVKSSKQKLIPSNARSELLKEDYLNKAKEALK